MGRTARTNVCSRNQEHAESNCLEVEIGVSHCRNRLGEEKATALESSFCSCSYSLQQLLFSEVALQQFMVENIAVVFHYSSLYAKQCCNGKDDYRWF